MKKRTKEEAIEKDPVVNDQKVPTKSKEKTGKWTAMEAFGPFLSTRNSVQVQLSPKKKKKLAKKRERKKKLRETAFQLVRFSVSLSLSPSLQKES